MNHHQRRNLLLLAAIAALGLVAAAVVSKGLQARFAPVAPEQALQQAWQRAHDLGAYHFTTDLAASAYPARALANIGQPGRKEQLHIEGSVNLPDRTLLLSLWQGGGSVLNPSDGLEIRIEGDRAYGRRAGGIWEEIDDFSGSFAPGGDLLVYLVGAKNVVKLGTETIDLRVQADPAVQEDEGQADPPAAPSTTYTRYAFDLDGPAVAEEVRQQWQRQLQQQGELPSGAEIQAPVQLHDATGSGELWVDSQGLPRRLTVEIAYPSEGESEGGGHATIETDFSGFPPQPAQDSNGWLTSALGMDILRSRTLDSRRIATQAALILVVVSLVLLILFSRRSPRVYAGLVITIILSMVVTPLIDGQRAAAYAGRQAEQRAVYEKRQEEVRLQEEFQEATHTSTWDPFQDSLAASEPISALPESSITNENSRLPGVGMIDSYQVTELLAGEEKPEPHSDADLDTLTYIEEKRLGTDPDVPDSDSDQLRDDLEARGFSYVGITWRSDPLSVDSNNDGQPDLQECWTELPLDLPSNLPCNLDTDSDSTPDLFDGDNDNDGVADGVDLSPMSSIAGLSGSNPLFVKLDDLTAGVLTFIDLQLRPTNAEHLTYSFSVLDWPTGDTSGQIQRVLDTTFADSMTDEEISKDPRSANGDLRLIPMLEITIPYRAGHTRNLPVKPGWTGTLGATTPALEEWVDMDILAQYGLTVRYADETGTMVMYAPLSLVTDEVGGASVAFNTRLPYQMMASGDWGSEHQVRAIWALQMLVDQCKEVPAGIEDSESWCAEAANRDEQIQIVHIYDETWVLSGVDVREDNGLQMSIAFEDPAHDANLEDDQNLWALAYGLDETWIAARDCDTVDLNGNCIGNSQRDLTVPEIVRRFDNTSNGNIPVDDARLWNIPRDALRVWSRDFAYGDLMVAVPMTHTQEILNQHFLQNGIPVTDAPTLMFIREEHSRSANLDSRAEVASWSGAHLTINMANEFVPLETLAAMNWAPYRYRDGVWEPYPMEEYVEVLDQRLAASFPPDLTVPDGVYVSDGQVIMARGFYLGMVQGSQEIVQSGDLIYNKPELSRDEELKAESIKVAGNIVLTVVKIAGERIADSSFMLLGLISFKPTSAREVFEYLGFINRHVQEKGGWSGWGKESVRRLSAANRLSIGTLIIFTLCSTVLFILSISIDSPVIAYIQGGLLVAANTIRWAASMVKFISEVKPIFKEAAKVMDAFKSILGKAKAPWSSSVKGAFVLTIIIEALIAIGTFIYTWAASHIKIGSLAWDKLLVDLIAKIVVKTLLWALNFIPVIGKAIYLLISAIDSLVAWICGFLSEKAQQSVAAEWLCGGISGFLTKLFGWFFYGQHNLVDLEDDQRWQLGTPQILFGDPAKGFAVGNTLSYQLTLTNSLHLSKIPVDWKAAAYWWQYSEDRLKRSTFAYGMSKAVEGEEVHAADLHSDLSLDQHVSEWIPGSVRDKKQTYTITRPVDTTAPGVELITAGINVTTTVYLDEGYAIPVQECIAVPGFITWIPICWIREDKFTGSANLGESFPWDVFPESLDEFYEMAFVDGGYSLAWGEEGELQFTRQKEFDGDMLLNATDGGPDPNDSTWDADNDGLSDYFELETGLKPDSVGGYDPDGDGLNDREELLLGSDPFKADTDGDGLTDRQERDGWEFAYGFDAAGLPIMGWVTSCPLLVDTDLDTLTDFQEYNYRYNPRATSDPNVLGFTSELSELDAYGSYSPSDGLVRSGDQLRYEANVENKTLLSSAQGLHEARFPEDRLSGSVAPRTFLLYPQERELLSGDLSVRSGISSGPANLTQTAGARITYALADSDYAQLVLHLEDSSTATTFADSSGNVPPHNGLCSSWDCPTRQVPGTIGSAVQFDSMHYQMILVPDVDISAGDFGVSFWFKTTQTFSGLFSSYDNSANLYLESGRVCLDVKIQEWTVPSCTGSVLYNDNKWHHLALSYSNNLGPMLYLDGILAQGYRTLTTRLNPSPRSGVALGYSSSAVSYAKWYTGLMDEVVVYDRALTTQDVAELYGRPLLAMHLDEPAGATTFTEEGGLNATCTGSTCPTAGRPGAVRNSVSFTGAQNIRFATGPKMSGKPFTIAAWILPTTTGVNSLDSAPQGILGQLNNMLDFSYPTLVRVGSGIKAAFGSAGMGGFVQMPTVPNVLTLNTWNHVVLTYGSNLDGKGQFDLYVNGLPKGDYVLSGYPSVNHDPTYFSVGNVWSAGTINTSYPASPFRGQIDEVLIYSSVFSEAQVEELYRNQADALHLTFDAPPGTYQFKDALGRAAGSCPADLSTCPTAGVTGRAGQAAEFDGVDNVLDAGVAPAVSGTGPLSLAAWVRTTDTKDQVIVNQRSAAVFNGEYVFGLTAAGKVYWFTYGKSGAATFWLGSTRAVNDGKWHHVAAVRDENGSAYIYVDGVLDASLPNTDLTKIAPLVTTNVYVGADIRDHAQYFEGAIDELHIVRRALSAAEVQSLVHRAPRFLLHLEETVGAYSFADEAELPHEATCASWHCPDAGVKGQVNLAAGFDGVDDGLLTTYEVPVGADKTAMAWVNPDSTSSGQHMVLAVTDNWSWSIFRNGGTWHVGTGSLDATLRDWDTGVEVQVGQWQHLAVVYAGNTARFFVNGHSMGEKLIGNHINAGQMSVGTERYTSSGSPWDGRIDEVAVYERALTDVEVESLWLYQGQWVQEMHTTPLLVDNDAPHSGLASGSPYRADQPVTLMIETPDATSTVVQAEWQVNSGAWQEASPCDAGMGATWCLTFDPAAFQGTGIYTIHTRATDAASNLSTVSSDPIYIDGTPPVVTLYLAADSLVQLQPNSIEPDAWKLPVSGTVQDPQVPGGVPGSGVKSLRVTLLDGYGHPLGSGDQIFPIQGSSWNTTLAIPGLFEGGAYTVHVEAEDQVGNLTEIDNRIYLDQSAPEASLVGLPPGGEMVALLLDESAGTMKFYDSSGYNHNAMCGAACPTAGLAGKYGQAVGLNGASQSMVVNDLLDFGLGEVTLAAWFKSSSQTWQTIAALSTTGTPAQDVLLVRLTDEGKVRFGYNPPGGTSVTNLTSPHTYRDGQWHHAAAVRQASELLLYVDGEIVAAATDSRPLSGALRLTLGQHNNMEFFNGLLDEMYLLPLALAGAEVFNLSAKDNLPAFAPISGVVSEVPLIDEAIMALHLEEPSGTSFSDSSAWANDASCSSGTCPSHIATGVFGQALQFDGIDDRLSIMNSSAIWSLQEDWTLSAWINPARLNVDQQILAYPQKSSPGGFGFGTHGAGLRFSAFGVGIYDSNSIALATGAWQHVAITLAGGNLTFYVDGIARQEITGTLPLQPNLIETDPVYVGMTTVVGGSTPSQLFKGGIDEVKLFNRSLSRDQILALGAKKHAGVSRLEMAPTWATPGSPLFNAPMPQDVQLYLPLDGTESASGGLSFLDISGQSHVGKCSGPVCPAVGPLGHSGGAALFDGVDDYLEIPLNVSETAYTLALWFKTGCKSCGIFSVDAGTRGTNGHDRHVYLNGGNVCSRVWYDQIICTAGKNYADGRWHQVVHTFGGAEGGQKIYLDGALVASGSKAASDFTTQDGINLGFSNDASLDYFNGLLDEAIIFNRALSAADVNALYLGTDTVLRLPLDEDWIADGTVLSDASSWEHFGTMTSGVGDAANKAVPGQIGSGAIQLDGVDDYVSAGDVDEVDGFGDFTISQWFSLDALGAASTGRDWASPVSKGAFDASNGWAVLVNRDSATKANHEINLYFNGSVAASIPAPTTDGWQTGRWYHYVFTRSGATLKGYLDGLEQVSLSSATKPVANSSALQVGKNETDYPWQGKLDDLRIYARGLSAEEVEQIAISEPWKNQVISPSGQGMVRSTYSTALNNLNLEGYYRIDLRSTDTFGNNSDSIRGHGLWSGLIDSMAPRASLQYQLTTVGLTSQVHYQFTAHDFGLVQAGMVSPCPASTTLTREYFNAPWYRAWTGEIDPSTGQLYALSGQCDMPYTGALGTLTVYDTAGNHTTVNATPLVLAAAAPPDPAPAGGGVLILTPNPDALLNSTLPLQIEGGAFSPGSLKTLFIRVDRRVIYTTHWARSKATDTTWMATWTPKGEGPHLIDVTLRDWDGNVYTDSVTVILDTRPPEVAVATQLITSNHLSAGQVTVTGTAYDTNGIAAVDLQVRGVWHPAVFSGGSWTASWIPGLGPLPDGTTESVVARATDRAGWTTLASADIYADAAAPAPVDLALSYQADGVTNPITQTGVTVRDPGVSLQMTWTASSDGSGLADYQAGWTTIDASGSTTTWSSIDPNQARLATITPAEAQKLTASLGARDTYGNTSWQDFGPVYVDSPLTPDFTLLDNQGGAYHGWMDSGCTLLGADRRLARIAPTLALRHGEQGLYATWDSQALRLAWSGANWSTEGDLFVYLDTAPGGSEAVFNPFTPATTLAEADSTLVANVVTLPGVTSTAPQSGAMLADYGVWVQDAETAWLLAWDGSNWVTAARLTETQFHYEFSAEGGLTDLYLPFDLLGISDPAANPLRLLAFATEEGALRLWAVLPRANPVTSLLATGGLGHILDALASLEPLTVPMTHFYQWPSLGSGVCPNGDIALDAGQTPYPDAEVQARLTTDPAGTVYHYMGDHLYTWSEYLLGDKPLDFSGLLQFLDNDHPYVQDGQALAYSLRLKNSGRDATHGVTARIWATAALTLPGGAPLPGDEHIYFQEIAIGDLLPGEERTVNFEGRVDLAFAQPRYEECLATIPDRPHLCELSLRLAPLKIEIVDQTHVAPLERIWADHRVDIDAPRFAGISYPGLHVSTSGARLGGYAYDDSGVSQLSLEVQRPDGSTVNLPCLNASLSSGSWSCDWDPIAANGGVLPDDGQIFQIRLRATDSFGLTGEPSPWQPFIIDTLPPEVTAQLPAAAATGLPASGRTLRLDGLISDNHGAAGVEVCLEDTCRSARTNLEGGLSTQKFTDLPAAPTPLAACGTGEIQRTFLVNDAFDIRSVGLGLRFEHPDNSQIRAELVSPSGTRVQVLSGEGDLGAGFKNLAVLLADAAAAAVNLLERDSDLSMPGFLHIARPDEPLSAFSGENAAGTWTLVLCDADASNSDGSYLGSGLLLQPQNTAALNGSWFQSLALPQLDGVEQTLTVYGLDDAGNRSTAPWNHTFVVDNIAPALSVIDVISQLQMTPDLTPQGVLTGTVTDGGNVRQLFAQVRTPEGQLQRKPVTLDGDSWSFALQPMIAGSHTIDIVAEDLAGNQASIGPFTVEVVGIPQADCLEAAPIVTQITAEPAAASPFSLTVTAVISNTGSGTLPAGMPVGLYVDDQLLASVAMVQELLPGTEGSVSISWPVDEADDYDLNVLPNSPEALNLCNPPTSGYLAASVRDLPLQEGWNLLSPAVDPFNADITVVQLPVAGRYRQIVGYDGGLLLYDPAGPPASNTLLSMDAVSGYWIDVLPALTPPTTTLRMAGSQIPVDKPLSLAEGWSLAGYLPHQTLAITDALATIDGYYTGLLGFAGTAASYYPDLDPIYNTLSEMVPGAGYWINTSQAITLTYPASVITPTVPVDLTGRLAQIRLAEQAAGVRPSYQWMNFFGQAALQGGLPIPTGTIVLAVDPQDAVCGATVVTHAGHFGLLACYGDDPTTALDEGGQPGDAIRLVLSSDGVLPDGQVIGIGAWASHGSRQETAPMLALQPPQVKSDPPWQQVRYGDVITETVFTAAYIGMVETAITAETFWSVDEGPWDAGLPTGMSLSAQVCTDARAGTSCEWRLVGKAGVPAGSYSVKLQVSDGANTASAQTTIIVEEEITLLQGVDAAVQYSDAITLTASLSDDDGALLAGKSLLFELPGSCSGEALTDASGAASYLCENGSLPAGQYAVSVSFVGEAGQYLPASGSALLTVTAEQAEVTFNPGNPIALPVGSAEGSGGAFSVVVQIIESSPDAGNTVRPGDINLAQVSMQLLPVGPGSPVAGICTPNIASGSGYDAVLLVACDFSDVPLNTYTAQAAVAGGYFTGYSEAVFTILPPETGITNSVSWFLIDENRFRVDRAALDLGLGSTWEVYPARLSRRQPS